MHLRVFGYLDFVSTSVEVGGVPKITLNGQSIEQELA